MKNLGGRPRKGSLEEKKKIVDNYYLQKCAEDASAMKKRGIYKNIADFAQEHGYDYCAYHFSKDPSIVEYIDTFTANTDFSQQDVLSVFVPMDLSLIVERSRDEIVETLRDRDRYYETLYKSANATLQPFRAKAEAYEATRTELCIQVAKNERLVGEKEVLAGELRRSKEENTFLRSYIKKYVLPEQAEEVFQASRDPKSAVALTTPYVINSINQQTKEDRALRLDAKQTALSLSFEDLFT